MFMNLWRDPNVAPFGTGPSMCREQHLDKMKDGSAKKQIKNYRVPEEKLSETALMAKCNRCTG